MATTQEMTRTLARPHARTPARSGACRPPSARGFEPACLRLPRRAMSLRAPACSSVRYSACLGVPRRRLVPCPYVSSRVHASACVGSRERASAWVGVFVRACLRVLRAPLLVVAEVVGWRCRPWPQYGHWPLGQVPRSLLASCPAGRVSAPQGRGRQRPRVPPPTHRGAPRPEAPPAPRRTGSRSGARGAGTHATRRARVRPTDEEWR